jgi:putative MATE family efflux protein
MGGAIFALSWPIIAESFLNSLVGLTDTVLSAGIDDGGVSADAVGGAAYVLWFVGLITQAIGVGATALVSRAVGGGKLGVANAAVGQTLLLAAVCGVVVGAIIALVAGPAAVVLNLSDGAATAFRQYMLYNAAGVPFTSLLFGAIACARGAGDSLRPLYAMVVVNVVNIVSSWLLSGVDLKTAATRNGERIVSMVLENPFDLDLGVRGIAIGTALANLVGCAVMLAMLAGGVGGVRARAARLRPHWHTLRRLVRVGIPNFLETFGMWIGNFMVILMVGWLGARDGGLMGSHLIAIRIEAFSFLPGFAFGVASATLVGQYLGAGDARLAKRAVWLCAGAASISMGLTGLLFILMPGAIVGLLTSQEVHLRLVPPALMVAGFVQVPFALSIVFRSALRGAGDVRAAMVITWVTTYALRLPMAWLFSGVDILLPGGKVIQNPSPYEWGLTGLWIGLCAEIVIRGLLFLSRFAQGKWAHVRV